MRISNEKWLNIAHESVQSGCQATDMRIHTGDKQLVSTGLAHPFLEFGLGECAVAPFREDQVPGSRCKLLGNFFPTVIGQPRTPKIGQQSPIRGLLIRRLSCVDHWHASIISSVAKSPNIFQRNSDLRPRIFVVESLDKVALHVMN